MKLLYSTIFNIILLSVCTFNATLFAKPKSLENAYKSCGLNGKTHAAILKNNLKTISVDVTQDTIQNVIELSLPCKNCCFCTQNIESTLQVFFDGLSKDNRKRIKRLRYFVISSVVQSCKRHELVSSGFKVNQKQSLRAQISEDYQDYRNEESASLPKRKTRSPFYYKERRIRKILKRIDAADLEFDNHERSLDELLENLEKELVLDKKSYANNLFGELKFYFSYSDVLDENDEIKVSNMYLELKKTSWWDEQNVYAAQDDCDMISWCERLLEKYHNDQIISDVENYLSHDDMCDDDEQDHEENDELYDDQEYDDQADLVMDFYDLSKSRGLKKWSKKKI